MKFFVLLCISLFYSALWSCCCVRDTHVVTRISLAIRSKNVQEIKRNTPEFQQYVYDNVTNTDVQWQAAAIALWADNVDLLKQVLRCLKPNDRHPQTNKPLLLMAVEAACYNADAIECLKHLLKVCDVRVCSYKLPSKLCTEAAYKRHSLFGAREDYKWYKTKRNSTFVGPREYASYKKCDTVEQLLTTNDVPLYGALVLRDSVAVRLPQFESAPISPDQVARSQDI